ncbi:MRL1 [Symbiodinium necroappetens]|uniref:MRL1 protein n=1 Tax=Symbiodinium necroappetens TaxID=1628268 RepID=A0A812K1S1_9DINO|nr:MRL1 [Symbiodinium necroappetens]
MLWQKAHDVAARLQSSDIEADAFSLNELLTCSRWRMGMQLPTALKVQLTPVTCASLLYACEWRVAVHLLFSVKEAALETSTMNFNAVTSACSRASAWRNTLLLASMLTRRFSADLKMASSTLAACGASDEWERALSLFFELQTAKLSNAFTYGAAISACGRGGCWLEAFCLLEEAAASEIEPDDVMLNSAISACRSEWAAAIALLQRFFSQNIRPTVTTYCAVMTACDRCEQPRKVLSVFGACVADVQPNAVAVSLGLRACDAGGWWHAAMRLLHEAAEAMVELDGQSFDAALGACRAGYWRTAMMLLAGAERNRLKTEAGGWSAIVTTYCRADCHQQLRSLMSSLRSKASIRLQRVGR